MKKMLLEKFGLDSSLFCDSPEVSVLQSVDKSDLLTRCSQLSGVKLTRGAIELLQMGTSELFAKTKKNDPKGPKLTPPFTIPQNEQRY